MLTQGDYLMISEKKLQGMFVKNIAAEPGVHSKTASRAPPVHRDPLTDRDPRSAASPGRAARGSYPRTAFVDGWPATGLRPAGHPDRRWVRNLPNRAQPVPPASRAP